MEWYRLDIAEVYREASAREEGLVSAEAAALLARFGPNRLGEEDRISRLRIFAGQFTSPFHREHDGRL